MGNFLSKTILKIAGWSIKGGIPDSIKKCVIVSAPHTSNWDFVLGFLGLRSMNINSKFLIKKEAFFFPLNFILKHLGGLPVDRIKSNNIVHQLEEHFKKNDSFFLAITPEGTRKPTKHWKRGFYYLACHTETPIALGFLDYKNKVIGIGKIIKPCGNFNNDMLIIKDFYKDKNALYPEKFQLPI